MLKIIKNTNNTKFSLFFRDHLVTQNIDFGEVQNDEKIIHETLEEFCQGDFSQINHENIIPELKKFFVIKYGKAKKIVKNKNLKQVKKEKGINKGNKILLILSGIPGSGKSTWVSENNLERFVVSSDNLRLLYSKTELGLHPLEQICQRDNREVFKKYYEIIEQKMKQGLFVVCDATHLQEKDFDRYVELAIKYDYEINVKVFDEDDLEVLLERNKKRGFKEVSKEVIEKFLERKKTFTIPDGIREIKKIKDLSNYNLEFQKIENNIYYIGDIQGCSTELKKFLEKYYNGDDYFVFCGDLLDRGYDNLGVLELMSSIVDNPKVILIKGNHDVYLEKYYHSNRQKVGSRTFDDETAPEIANFPLEKIGKIVNKFVYACSFQVAGKNIFACHGGVSKVNDFISDLQLVRGVGEYGEHQVCDEVFSAWSKTEKDRYYLVHGHRNSLEVQTKSSKKTFNLEGKVEFGGELRIVKFFKDGVSEIIEIASTAPKKEIFQEKSLLDKFGKNAFINIKDLGNGLYSINFTRKAFYEKNWDKETIKARGLFIGKNDEIYARSYDKFFNVGEMKKTKIKNLAESFTFPVSAYKKYNGFLGIAGQKDGEILYLSKTSNSSEFALMVKKHLQKFEEKLKKYCEKNLSLIFEICDHNDKHIVYEDERPILIEVVENTLEYFKKLPYDELCAVAKDIGVEVKKREAILKNNEELLDFIKKAENVEFEGFILEGSGDINPFLTKTKSLKYLFWKEIRRDIEKKKQGKDNLIHKEVLEKLEENGIDFLELSIPEIIEKSKNLGFSEIPKIKHDKE